MKTIKEYLCALSVNLGAADKNCKFRRDLYNDRLVLTFFKPEQGKRQCVTSIQLIIQPDHFKKHAMLVEEIWVGFDAEGCGWSDHMGGRSIDCNGLNRIDAMTKLVNTIKADHAELFTKGA